MSTTRVTGHTATRGQRNLFWLRFTVFLFLALTFIWPSFRLLLGLISNVSIPYPPRLPFILLSFAPLVSAILAWSPQDRVPDLVTTIILASVVLPACASLHMAYWSVVPAVAALLVLLGSRITHRLGSR